MVKFITLALAVTVISFILAQGVAFGQTATPTSSATPTPRPTEPIPSGAPATGFAPY